MIKKYAKYHINGNYGYEYLEIRDWELDDGVIILYPVNNKIEIFILSIYTLKEFQVYTKDE